MIFENRETLTSDAKPCQLIVSATLNHQLHLTSFRENDNQFLMNNLKEHAIMNAVVRSGIINDHLSIHDQEYGQAGIINFYGPYYDQFRIILGL